VSRLKIKIPGKKSRQAALTPELNPSAQRCLPKFFTGNFNF
jgi:hypothetical protein